MNDLFASDADTNGPEPLDEGGTWLLDLVSAVDHLRRGYRPGFTVWDALAEAIDWAQEEVDNADDGTTTPRIADPFTALRDGHTALQRAIRTWVIVMAERYNSGHEWPHPIVRRGFPPPFRDEALGMRTAG
jgi:hypothetical protein